MSYAHLGILTTWRLVTGFTRIRLPQDIFISCFSKEGDKINLVLYNALGEIIFQQTSLLNSGENFIILRQTEIALPDYTF